ncbi:hypothetical protein GGX14DRAFT_612701 [Mycena pura]|uniref:C2H2-type domain-containing protein n=1 Tax=Mycena pura TaxID=153505 RepID=A0AAD7E4E7_9AGAR|nr:hypothetical protein GGX14DRAFT_612701 [Mycena pura]
MGRTTNFQTVVSAETVVQLSKSTLLPFTIKCDAPVYPPANSLTAPTVCGQEFGAWKVYFKHLVKKHTLKQKTQGGGIAYICKMNKCSAHARADRHALKLHVEGAHMKSVAMPCPFVDCRSQDDRYTLFLKEKDLIAHVVEKHFNLIGKTLDVRCGLFHRSFDPQPPMHPLPVPPDLPEDKISMAALRLDALATQNVHMGWFDRIQQDTESALPCMPSTPAPAPTPSSTQMPFMSTPPRTPTARRMLLHPPTASALAASNPETDTVKNYDFDNLLDVFYDQDTRSMKPEGILEAPLFAVERMDYLERGQLVLPLRMRQNPEPEAPPPPKSIFHEVLKEHVYAKMALGEG